MAYDKSLADRIRKILSKRKGVTEVGMMGGLCFMLRSHMCCGISNDDLVVRVGPERYDQALRRPHAHPMNFTGHPLRGLVFVGPKGRRREQDLWAWVRQAADFVRSLRPKARSKPSARKERRVSSAPGQSASSTGMRFRR